MPRKESIQAGHSRLSWLAGELWYSDCITVICQLTV